MADYANTDFHIVSMHIVGGLCALVLLINELSLHTSIMQNIISCHQRIRVSRSELEWRDS